MGIPTATLASVEVETVVLDWAAQVAVDLKAAWAEELEAQEDLVAAAVMAPAGVSMEMA